MLDVKRPSYCAKVCLSVSIAKLLFGVFFLVIKCWFSGGFTMLMSGIWLSRAYRFYSQFNIEKRSEKEIGGDSMGSYSKMIDEA